MVGRYYEVWVASARYHGKGPLTYSSDKILTPGRVVKVSLQNWSCLGIINREVSKPSFKVKPVNEVSKYKLPPVILKIRNWLEEYYPAPSGTVTQLFLPTDLNTQSADKQIDAKRFKAQSLPSLNKEQQAAMASISNAGTFILHGQTGSGKTRIYQELSKQVISQNKSVVILTPEISLTAQLFNNFQALFGNQVVLVHSNLTASRRRKAWMKIATAKQPLVIIGARSAIFSPINDLGLIVVDEAHEPAYKQDQMPYYHAVRVAGQLAMLHNAKLVIGSATPSLVDYFVAKQRQLPIIELQKPAIKKTGTKPSPIIVDIKDRSHFTHNPYISNDLISELESALERGEQGLLFLNRRGTARVVLCQNCGWHALCPNCDTPLTYHGDLHKLRCHSCNYNAIAPPNCPVCGSTDITFRGAGTKAISDEVKRLFPTAKVMRFDNDNKKSERFEQNYEQILNGDVDIIVGTQTLAKGLDLPKLSVVGVVVADSSLYIPDFMAQERTFQLINQVIGRTSRGSTYGQVIIQTYEPSSTMIRDAIGQNWENFYAQELIERRQYLFPPFCYLLKLTCRRHSPESARLAAKKLAQGLRQEHLAIIINGPAPAFHEKHGDRFEWQLIIKAKRRGELLKVISALPSGWSYDIDPINLL